MLDLSKVKGKGLSNTIFVKGKPFSIVTDFQYYITFSRMMKETHELSDFDMFYTGSVPAFRQMGLNELIKFACPVNELPRNVEESDEIIIDYDKDSDLIYAAFQHYYNIDLLDPNLHLHWHKFLALLNSIKDTKLNDVMSFRSYEPAQNDPKEYKKNMLKMKAMWRIEKEIPDSIMAEIDDFDKKNGIKK